MPRNDVDLEILNREKTQKVFYEIGTLSREDLVKRYKTLAWSYINQSEVQALEEAVERCHRRASIEPLLDVGCGTGRLLAPLSRRYRVMGLDFSESFLEQLKKEHPEIETRFGNAVELPFETGSFRSVLCVRLIQHLTASEQSRFLEECRRVLPKGGFLILLNYNALSFLTLYKKLCQSRLGKAWGRWPLRKWNWEVDDYHFPWELSSLCRAHGFRVIQLRTCTPGEPDMDRFLGLDAWMGAHAPALQQAYYRLLMLLNDLGKIPPFRYLFSRVLIVCEKE